MKAILAAALLLVPPAEAREASWKELEPGMDLARFEDVTVLRVDPARWELKLACTTGRDPKANRTPRAWAEQEGFAAAANAGMFATDYLTHIGFLGCGDDVQSSRVNQYQSAAAFSPKRKGLPPFRIFDLDVTPLADVQKDYACVAQNLRLVKRPGENRWKPQERRWSESALGEDAEGRILFIHAREPRTAHGLNELLLELPIGLVAAQHLEGGPEAQLFVRAGGTTLELAGSREGGSGWPIPNVLGVVKRGR
jgi:hypothetical protein